MTLHLNMATHLHAAPTGTPTLPVNWMAHLSKPAAANGAIQHTAPAITAAHHAAFIGGLGHDAIHHDAAPLIATVGVPEVVNTPPVVA